MQQSDKCIEMPFNLPPSSSDKVNLIVACTGSVAALKIPLLLKVLVASSRFNIVLLPSHTSLTFFTLASLPPDVLVFQDSEEWTGWDRGSPILHIELRKWVDVLLIAPLSAHSLAKIAAGLSDTLLLEVLRAWDYSANKKLIAAPAMNTAMYIHPYTARHLTALNELGFQFIGPVVKVLACGDDGIGAMSEISDIVNLVKSAADELILVKANG